MLHKSVWPDQLYSCSYNGWLRKFGFSLAAIKRILSRVDIDDLSHKTEQFKLGEIEDLIILIPQRDNYDEEFPTIVTSFGKQKTKLVKDIWLRQADPEKAREDQTKNNVRKAVVPQNWKRLNSIKKQSEPPKQNALRRPKLSYGEQLIYCRVKLIQWGWAGDKIYDRFS